ncbi:MAG TPA: alanine dehydrogenase [Bacteroidales bacterium]|nr:alanine dehydrogenase [Bacteroidales bacterium]HPT02365.1 alanine dehydrogenase [Bacteroidales bacterium]
MDLSNNNLQNLLHGAAYMPREETLEIKKTPRQLTIGIPRETSLNENRIALVPDAVGLLVQQGHRVIIENKAGESAHFSNHDYSEMGGEIVPDVRQVYTADIVVKIAPPDCSETDMLTSRQAIISSLYHPGLTEEYFRKLTAKKSTALAFEFLQDKTGTFPIIRAMSEIAGNTSILLAAEFMSHAEYGRGKMLGGFSGITPSEVVILGAGTVGEFAARAALGMGAFVKIFDNSIYKLRRLQNNLNVRIFTSILQPRILLNNLKTADVVIGAVHSTVGRTPCLVTEEMVQQMKEGAVLIDVSIDQGGCFETSHPTDHQNPVFRKYGVTHYCVPNIPSKVPHTASYALSNILTPILEKIGEEGGLEQVLHSNYGVRQSVYIFNGISTNKFISDTYRLPFQDINLLMAAFH